MTRKIDHRRLGQVRQGQGEIANHIIDEFAAGRLSRRDFIRRATVVGISASALGPILAACSSSSSAAAPGTSASGSAAGKPGAVIRAGITTPAAAINPLTVADQGGQNMLAQTGEYLILSGQKLDLKPVLATSWSPNSKADVWTFKIRKGVKFHNGAPADGRRRGVHLPASNQPQGQLGRAVRVRRRAHAGRGGEGRRLHGGLPSGGAERKLPLPDVLRQLQHDHPAEGL